MENDPTLGISHPGFWKIQKGEWEIKQTIKKNTDGVRNSAMEKASGSATIHKIIVIWTVPHQPLEEALSYQAREKATTIWP